MLQIAKLGMTLDPKLHCAVAKNQKLAREIIYSGVSRDHLLILAKKLPLHPPLPVVPEAPPVPVVARGRRIKKQLMGKV